MILRKIYILSFFLFTSVGTALVDAGTVITCSSHKAFQSIIKEHKNIIVDFYASWCQPCKKMMPILEKVVVSLDVTLVKVNVENCKELTEKFGIESLPTLIFFKGSTQVGQSMGYKDEKQLKNIIKNVFSL